MSLDDALRFANLLAAGLAAGILVAVSVGVVPVIRRLAPGNALAVKQIFDPLIDRVNPPAAVLSTLAAIAILLFADDLSSASTMFTVVGLLGSIGVGATSLGVNMPINRRMSGWSAESPPAEFGAVMGRWIRVHTLRMTSGVIAFGAYVVATLAAID